MSVILAIPSTATPNLNSGMQIIHRYNYWILMPVIMLLGEMMQSILLQRKILLAGFTVGQIFITHTLYNLPEPFSSYIRFTTVELILLDYFPRWYNPIPEIFIERGSNREISSSDDFHFWVYHGEIRKILFHGKDKIASFPKCLDRSEPEAYVVSKEKAENGWQYWNLRKGCRIDDWIDGYISSAYIASTPVTHKWRACDLLISNANAQVDKETCEVTSRADSSGIVTYGPYVQLPQGNYSFAIEYTGTSLAAESLAAESLAADIGDWDVVAYSSLIVLGKGVLPGTNGNRGTLRGTFTVPPKYIKDFVEIRTFVQPDARLTIHGIELKRID
jgi:hypothetical protein